MSSAAGLPEPVPEPTRKEFQGELDQLRLQVELMGVRVDENLERMREVLRTGDEELARAAFAADDDIDSMNVSLTERCYLMLGREAPVASDLRFIVSVLRIIGELERIGDLALRVVKLQPDHALWTTFERPWDILVTLVDEAVELYRIALRAWSAQDVRLASDLASRNRSLDLHHERLLTELMRLDGPEAARAAVSLSAAGRAAERIADHAVIVGARLRYLLTGEPANLVEEVR
ncbi:MAG: phosphate signaling complex protein PhoU [Acidimicrobiia bacterium]